MKKNHHIVYEKVTKFPLLTRKETVVEILGTEKLYIKTHEEIAETIASILKGLPGSTQIIVGVNAPLIIRRVEMFKPNQPLLEDSCHTAQIVNTLFDAGILS